MPVFHPNGPAASALPHLAAPRGLIGWIRALFEAFREARSMENDAFKAGRLINR